MDGPPREVETYSQADEVMQNFAVNLVPGRRLNVSVIVVFKVLFAWASSLSVCAPKRGVSDKRACRRWPLDYAPYCAVRRLFPFIALIYGDGGNQGKMQATVAATGTWKLEIVKRANLHHFQVLPKRWIVERTLAWISRNRRLARDFERYARTVAAFVRLAMIRIMLRRLTRPIPSA